MPATQDTTSICALWAEFRLKHTLGLTPIQRGRNGVITTQVLSRAQLEYARREWVSLVKDQVRLGCMRFSWPTSPEEIDQLQELLKWTSIDLWNFVNEFFSISAHDHEKRPDPGNPSYQTWHLENGPRQANLPNYMQNMRQAPPTPVEDEPDIKGNEPTNLKGKGGSESDEKEDSNKDKPFTMLYPRFYSFTPKWFHKIWALDDDSSRLKNYALRKWISLMKEFHAISKEYGEDTVLKMLKIRGEEAAEKAFASWDNFLQALADRLYDDWEQAIREWPRGDDEYIGTPLFDGTKKDGNGHTIDNETMSEKARFRTQAPTPALTPANEKEARNKRAFLRPTDSETRVTEKETETATVNNQQKHAKRQERHAKVDNKNEGESSMEEDEILISRRVDRQPASRSRSAKPNHHQGRNLSMKGENRYFVAEGNISDKRMKKDAQANDAQDNPPVAPMFLNISHLEDQNLMQVPPFRQQFTSAPAPVQGRHTSKPRASFPPTQTDPFSIRPPPVPLATKPSIAQPTKKQVGLEFENLSAPTVDMARKTYRQATRTHSGRRPQTNAVCEDTAPFDEAAAGLTGDDLGPEMQAYIEELYANAGRKNAERSRHASYDGEVSTYILMEEGELGPYQQPSVAESADSVPEASLWDHPSFLKMSTSDSSVMDSAGDESSTPTTGSLSESTFTSSTEDESSTPTLASPKLTKHFGGWGFNSTGITGDVEFDVRGQPSRTSLRNVKDTPPLEPVDQIRKTKSVRWDQKPAGVRYYTSVVLPDR